MIEGKEVKVSSNTFYAGWAKAVFCLVNLVFVVLDTTGVDRDSDILRVLVVSPWGDELYNQLVKPVRHPNEPNTAYTGITQEELDQSQTLEEQWPAIQAVLSGKFVLAYGLNFVQARLSENAQAYKLEPIYLVGACLHETAAHYCHRNTIKLAQALAHVGFPRHIGPGASERAHAQIALLNALADGQPRLARIAALPPAQEEEDLDYPF